MTSNPKAGPTAGPRRWGRAQDRPVTDPYALMRKPHEPTICPQCGAVFREGRWQWAARPEGAHETLCPACRRINDDYPAGVISLSGGFLNDHKQEILNLIRYQEELEKAEHPENRVMKIEDTGAELIITTTDIHLPERIGKALRSAFHGELALQYDEDGYFVRVNWHRAD